MVQPINYMAQIPQVDLARSLTSGLQLGATYRQIQDQRIAQQQAQEAKQQFATDLQAAQADGSQKAWLKMIGDYPQFEKPYAYIRNAIGEDQVKNEFNKVFELSVAMENKNPEVTMQKLQVLIDGNANSGRPTGIYQQAFDLIKAGKVTAGQALINQGLAILDPERFKKMVEAQSAAAEAPSTLSEKVAKAQQAATAAANAVATAPDDIAKAKAQSELAQAQAKSAAVAARFEERKVLQEFELSDAQINNYAAQQDIAKQNQRIAAMQAQEAKEGNVLKRQELQFKIDTAREARNQSVRDKHSLAQNVLGTFDNTLLSVDKLLNNWGKTKDGKIDPNLSNETVRDATGPIRSQLFTTSQDVADFEEQVGSLESQAFLSQVEKMRGLGALTEREGGRLVNALASLSLRQSPKQLAENIVVVKDLMKKARDSTAAKYGDLPPEPTTLTGGGLSPEEQAELDALRQRFPERR